MGTEALELGGSTITADARTKPNFAVRTCEVVVAAASVLATLPIVALSFSFYGIVALLGKVRPLRSAYHFLSRVYDQLLERLGQKVLRDARDTPALRLMMSLSLTALPIFVAQLVWRRPSLLLAGAFYLSLYGPKFERFVRMFSAKHLEAHRRQGYFSDAYDKVFGRYMEFFLGYLYGNVPELDRTVHVRLHHREDGGPDDTTSSREYDRTSRVDFFRYLADNVGTVIGLAPYFWFRAHGDAKNARRLLRGMALYYAYFIAIFLYSWRIGILYALVPLLCMNFITALTAWVQHAFYNAERPDDYFAHTVTVCDDWNFMNEGYHLCHHHRSGLHWTEMPSHMEGIRGQMRESGSLVFRDLDFIGLFRELTLLRRMDVLAEKLVPWEPMTHEQKLALLAKRTSPTFGASA